MIVISGALVLVALVLLIIGLISTSLGFVYASIAVSVVAFVFLLIGILQRRGEQVPETASGAVPTGPTGSPAPAAPAAQAGSDVEGVTAILPGGSRADAEETTAPVAAAAASSDDAVSGAVLVVPGRPRYHVAGCRYLTGKDPEEVDVATARADGYTSCGVCKPDAALAEAAAPAPAEELPPAAAIVAAEEAGEPAPDPVTSARRTTRATATTTPGRAPAKKAATKAPAKAAKKAPAKAAAADTATKPGNVVVIPDRGKFHKADCRFVRDASDTKEMTRAAASRQGYAACGVCKP